MGFCYLQPEHGNCCGQLSADKSRMQDRIPGWRGGGIHSQAIGISRYLKPGSTELVGVAEPAQSQVEGRSGRTPLRSPYCGIGSDRSNTRPRRKPWPPYFPLLWLAAAGSLNSVV